MAKGSYENRFYLVFSRRQDISELINKPPELIAFTSHGKLFVTTNLTTGDGGELVVRNTLGAVVFKSRLNGFGTHEMDLNLASGMYIVSYSGRTAVFTKKIINSN
jgi:hypothetical protein